ncbi:MAG: hypothetical protein MEQ84_13130 [Mesorhizobium sp.]|nr:hypothetical protein [Mesorhizobium sp.]
MSHTKDVQRIHNDAKPQYVRTRKGAHNSGVSSAEPRVITGDEDATFETHPERDEQPERDPEDLV